MIFWSRRSWQKNLLGFLLVLLLWGLFVVAFALLLHPEYPRYFPLTMVEQILMYGGLLIASLVGTWFYDRRSVTWLGLGLHRWTVRELLRGALLAIGGAILVLICFLIVEGTVERVDVHTVPLIGYLLTLTGLAIGEEVLFRGYFFQRGVELFGPTLASMLFASMFAIAHVANPSATIVSILNIFLAGLLFSGLYLRTGSLWAPIGYHAAWNIAIGLVLGLPISGIVPAERLFRVTTMAPDVVSGSRFGPEGGIVTTILLIATGALLVYTPYLQVAPWVFARNAREFLDHEGEPGD